ncbi:hypothetical protein GPECTOR_48g454 [Gonium pectorale]|uniref:BTB domain-containing protein n=1 Tax=Gonium pectorale TaxID=33097 RepID=A0A150G887_GONPE|nr:hypothetical protein GPECTOR_48g454 [Gonium pectorale]|eukprot:KXZ46021.1 hypothetical protein GPECTOR_48g454 [Gonium pectorale]
MKPSVTHGSAAAPPAEPGRVTLTFPSGETLSAQVVALQNASRVLKNALAQPLPTPGVLALDDDADAAAAWTPVVQMAEMSAYPPELVKWDNLEGLLRLADKYDMQVVGAACADFLTRNKASLTLDEPLTSPKNVLLAASLIDRHYRGGGSPAGYRGADIALKSALADLRQSASARAVAAKLRALNQDERYAKVVSAPVQVNAQNEPAVMRLAT